LLLELHAASLEDFDHSGGVMSRLQFELYSTRLSMESAGSKRMFADTGRDLAVGGTIAKRQINFLVDAENGELLDMQRGPCSLGITSHID
jgi:hypothetical protein